MDKIKKNDTKPIPKESRCRIKPQLETVKEDPNEGNEEENDENAVEKCNEALMKMLSGDKKPDPDETSDE